MAYVAEDVVLTSCKIRSQRNELVNERSTVQADSNGWITPPEGPGLGITINEDVVASLLVAESGW